MGRWRLAEIPATPAARGFGEKVGEELWLTNDPFVAEEGGGAAPASLDNDAGWLRPLRLQDRQARRQCTAPGTPGGCASMWGRASGGWPSPETSGEASSTWSVNGDGGGLVVPGGQLSLLCCPGAAVARPWQDAARVAPGYPGEESRGLGCH
jgi:hypothetical protein